MRRPLEVTIVAGLIILFAVVSSLWVLFLAAHRPEVHLYASMMAGDRAPPITQRAVVFLAGVVEIVAAILMLRGWDMGRTIYCVIGLILLAFGLATTPMPVKLYMLVDLAVLAIFLAILYQPNASRWFRQEARRF